jgi:hypothetical protein
MLANSAESAQHDYGNLRSGWCFGNDRAVGSLGNWQMVLNPAMGQ